MKRRSPTTDIMEAQFGPVRAEVLLQTARRREVLVRVRRTGQVLEYAVVSFEPAGTETYPAVHQEIRAGALIGQAFRRAGAPFLREENAATRVRLPKRLRDLFGTDEGHGLRIDAAILVGADRLPYARNRETYSPAIKWPDQVR
ncbi:MAG: hypothetical protein WD926_00375 [Patescibacteria group bacterium]